MDNGKLKCAIAETTKDLTNAYKKFFCYISELDSNLGEEAEEHIVQSCDRILNSITMSTVEDFAKIGGMLRGMNELFVKAIILCMINQKIKDIKNEE